MVRIIDINLAQRQMSKTGYLISLFFSIGAICIGVLNIWGGWTEQFYERNKGSYMTWHWLRLLKIDRSKKNCVLFIKIVSYSGIILISIGMFVNTYFFLQR